MIGWKNSRLKIRPFSLDVRARHHHVFQAISCRLLPSLEISNRNNTLLENAVTGIKSNNIQFSNRNISPLLPLEMRIENHQISAAENCAKTAIFSVHSSVLCTDRDRPSSGTAGS